MLNFGRVSSISAQHPLMLQDLPVKLEASQPLNAEESIEQLKESLEIYIPSAPWITREFMKFTPDQIALAFSYIANLLTDKNKRTYYFGLRNKRNAKLCTASSLHDWLRYLWQCKVLIDWVNNTYIVFDRPAPYLYTQYNEQVPSHAVKLITQWASCYPEAFEAYKTLYMFYFDCLSQIFYRYVGWAYRIIYDAADFQYILRELEICYQRMKHIINCMSSMQDQRIIRRYTIIIQRYESVLRLLRQEYYKATT